MNSQELVPNNGFDTGYDTLTPKAPADSSAVDDTKSQQSSPSSPYAVGVISFFVFLCVATGVRSCEAGLVSSMMADIKIDLNFSFQQEGVISSSPDFGLVPGAIIAPFVFSYTRAHRVVWMTCLGIACMMSVACLTHQWVGLMVGRAVCGLFWGFCAVHWPAWINHHVPEARKTMFMGLFNAFLLVGVVFGYVLGSYTTHYFLPRRYAWTSLYLFDAFMMLICAIVSYRFSPQLVQVVKLKVWNPRADEEVPEEVVNARSQRTEGVRDGPDWIPAEYMRLLSSMLYMINLGYSGCVAGASAFILYFISQITTALDMSQTVGRSVILGVMVVAPVTGNILGAWLLTRLGGYQNHKSAFGMMFVCTAGALISCILSAVAALRHSVPLFIPCFFFLIFFSALPVAATTGIAISIVPGVPVHASSIQFFLQNVTKLICPLVGGAAVGYLGLLRGFFVVLCTVVAMATLLAFSGWIVASKLFHERSWGF